MAKANGAYHKRDLYSDVTARILAELESGTARSAKRSSLKVDRGSVLAEPLSHLEELP